MDGDGDTLGLYEGDLLGFRVGMGVGCTWDEME